MRGRGRGRGWLKGKRRALTLDCALRSEGRSAEDERF